MSTLFSIRIKCSNYRIILIDSSGWRLLSKTSKVTRLGKHTQISKYFECMVLPALRSLRNRKRMKFTRTKRLYRLGTYGAENVRFLGFFQVRSHKRLFDGCGFGAISNSRSSMNEINQSRAKGTRIIVSHRKSAIPPRAVENSRSIKKVIIVRKTQNEQTYTINSIFHDINKNISITIDIPQISALYILPNSMNCMLLPNNMSSHEHHQRLTHPAIRQMSGFTNSMHLNVPLSTPVETDPLFQSPGHDVVSSLRLMHVNV